MGAAPSGCRTSRQSISSPRSARSKAKQIRRSGPRPVRGPSEGGRLPPAIGGSRTLTRNSRHCLVPRARRISGRARTPICRVHDPAGMRVSISARGTLVPRPRPCRRRRLRPAGLYLRAHDPAGMRDFVPRARPCGRGRRTMVRCTARAAGARIARHAAIIFQRAYSRDAVPEHAGRGRSGDGRTLIGRAAAGRNPGRRCGGA